MNFRQTQPNFSRGELGPQLYGRFDADVWQASVREARNVFVLKFGGLTKRPGTRLVGEVLDDSAPNRLIPFQFSTSQTYALEMGQGYMAPCAFGGRLLEDELQITAITNAIEAKITAEYHGYAEQDRVWLTGIEGELGEFLNNRNWRVVNVIDDNNFEIDADTSAQAAFTESTGGITRVAPPAPPPPPPPVPTPTPEPTEPQVGGGGGGGFGGRTDRLEEY